MRAVLVFLCRLLALLLQIDNVAGSKLLFVRPFVVFGEFSLAYTQFL